MESHLLKPQFITDETGQRISVILSIAEFEEISELLEDLADAKTIESRRTERGIPHETAMAIVKAGDELPD